MYRPVIVLLIMGLILLTACQPGNEQEAAADLINVETTNVVELETRVSMEFSGLLQPSASIEIYPEAPGTVEDIFEIEGTHVRAEQPLALIEQTDYHLGLQQAEAAWDVAEVAHRNAEADYNRQKQLQDEGFSSDTIMEGVGLARDAAAAQLKQAEAALNLARRQFEKTVITAPAEGYLGGRFLEIGQLAGPQNPAYILHQIKRLKINLSVNEDQIGRIAVNSIAEITVSQNPDDVFFGRVVFAGMTPGLDGSYPVKIEIDNSELTLRPGWSCTIHLFEPETSNELVIPGIALNKKAGRWTAYILDQGKVVERQVALKSLMNNRVLIESGLEAGEQLLVKGQAYCKPGDPVEVLKHWDSLDELLANLK